MTQKITKTGYNILEGLYVEGFPELVWHLLNFELFTLNLILNVDNPMVRKKNQLILLSSILLTKIQQPIPRVGGRMVLYYTLYNVILRIAWNFLETRENIKILKKKIQNGRLKKMMFFKIANSQYFFLKILWIRRWVSRIDCCKGHRCGSTYMAVRLSDICSKMA